MVVIKPNSIYNMDCIPGMKLIQDNQIDLIITDPPFGIDFKKTKDNYNRTSSNVLEGYGEVKIEDYEQFTKDWLPEASRILKPNGSMYVFSGWNNLRFIENTIADLGLFLQSHVIWKYQFGVRTTRKYTTSHWHLLFVTKHKTNYNFYPNCRFTNSQRTEKGGSARYRDMEDVWEIKREYWHGKQKTPTKLPSEIIQKILGYSSKADDLIFDPFLGSGQVAVNAKQLNRKYLGFELVKAYYDFAKKRLK